MTTRRVALNNKVLNIMAQIDIRQVRKSYGKTPTLHGVDLTFETGEFVVILGPRAAASPHFCE